MSDLDANKELTNLIRGFFSLPVLSSLSRLGLFETLRKQETISPADFDQIPNKKLLKQSLDYLARIGLLESIQDAKETYKLSSLGGKIVQRSSSFHVPHSYHNYMENHYSNLLSKDETAGVVDRLENIIGSGKAHLRYFPHVVSYLKRRVKFDRIVDVGCGDGHFLDFLLSSIPTVNKAIGVDLSEISVEETGKRLRSKFPSHDIYTLQSDASQTDHWGKKVLELSQSDALVLSMWFLIHEISKGDPQNTIGFLKEVHTLFPKTPIVICEIVQQEAGLLAQNKAGSIMPEYLFFHDISGQGVLSWKMYQQVRENIPYEVKEERLFDEMTREDGSKEPSAFIWHLSPTS